MRNDEALSADQLETVSGGRVDAPGSHTYDHATTNTNTNWGLGPQTNISTQINNFVAGAFRTGMEAWKSFEYRQKIQNRRPIRFK